MKMIELLACPFPGLGKTSDAAEILLTVAIQGPFRPIVFILVTSHHVGPEYGVVCIDLLTRKQDLP